MIRETMAAFFAKYFLSPDFALQTKGFCTAAVEKPIPGREKVEVNCDFYRPKVINC